MMDACLVTEEGWIGHRDGIFTGVSVEGRPSSPSSRGKQQQCRSVVHRDEVCMLVGMYIAQTRIHISAAKCHPGLQRHAIRTWHPHTHMLFGAEDECMRRTFVSHVLFMDLPT